MSEDMKTKLAIAQVYLARLVMLDAPAPVISSVKDWCQQLEKDNPLFVGKQTGHEQGVSISDSATVELADVRRRN
jgi:hypothetical protein